MEALETRERKIRDSIEQAEQNRLTAEQRLADYEAKLSGAAQEAEAIVAEAKAKAQRLLEENEQRLRTDSERIQAETTQEIERERRKALQDIRNEAADLALTVAEKVLARSLSDDDHRRLARESRASRGRRRIPEVNLYLSRLNDPWRLHGAYVCPEARARQLV